MPKFPPEQDTWEPRSALLRDVPDVVQLYKSMESVYSIANADVNALVIFESAEAIHAVENENNDVNENVVVYACHHEHETRTPQQKGQSNVSLLCADYSVEIDSVVASGVDSEVHHE